MVLRNVPSVCCRPVWYLIRTFPTRYGFREIQVFYRTLAGRYAPWISAWASLGIHFRRNPIRLVDFGERSMLEDVFYPMDRPGYRQ